MMKKNDFVKWDLSTVNDMCFNCARPDRKDLMCSWIRSEDPVPGWVAIEASELKGIQSVKILRCPQFLDSPDDPGMTREEYLQSCRGLVIELYGKVLEFKSKALAAEEARSHVSGELIRLRKSYKELEAQFRAKESPPPPEGAA